MINVTQSNEISEKLKDVPESELIDYIVCNYGYDVLNAMSLREIFDNFDSTDFISYICNNYRSKIFEELDLDDPLLDDTQEG